MNQKPAGIGRMVLVLTSICVVMAFLLSLVYSQTEERAKKQLEQLLERSLKEILPEYDNSPVKDLIYLDDKKDKELGQKCEYELNKGCRIYPAKKGKKLVGLALGWQSNKGFGGTIRMLVGITPKGEITGINILSHSETPGLGAKIAEPEFQKQFLKKTLKNFNWKVDKDGGDVKSITGATISSRAITEAVRQALEFYDAHKKIILKKAEEKCGL